MTSVNGRIRSHGGERKQKRKQRRKEREDLSAAKRERDSFGEKREFRPDRWKPQQHKQERRQQQTRDNAT